MGPNSEIIASSYTELAKTIIYDKQEGLTAVAFDATHPCVLVVFAKIRSLFPEIAIIINRATRTQLSYDCDSLSLAA